MKAAGVVRKIDKLGRIVIPKEVIKRLNIEVNSTLLEVKIEDEKIILEKYDVPSRACAVTGEVSHENKIYEGNICLSPKGAYALYSQIVEDNWSKIEEERRKKQK
ncbi:AbrB/MazE/SpoVT family DNA-binding domain-containing protein [Priestia aryabhattai]|uniref:AbrB/MazE/SpoVT family DNA-binding domain-containing protein n=1 Tax=Priestia aryabhattai TaxID=412384 RepID=UPI001C8ECAEE|nr:AbrB/MazE/SpoVT family DNA-binding domain-containing protein [Priestia aryabhattai]MBX9998160.1 AbrB/MazE/SpoVT family DNA-binding domain-containing protein [Priestia aryabhattai]